MNLKHESGQYETPGKQRSIRNQSSSATDMKLKEKRGLLKHSRSGAKYGSALDTRRSPQNDQDDWVNTELSGMRHVIEKMQKEMTHLKKKSMVVQKRQDKQTIENFLENHEMEDYIGEKHPHLSLPAIKTPSTRRAISSMVTHMKTKTSPKKIRQQVEKEVGKNLKFTYKKQVIENKREKPTPIQIQQMILESEEQSDDVTKTVILQQSPEFGQAKITKLAKDK